MADSGLGQLSKEEAALIWMLRKEEIPADFAHTAVLATMYVSNPEYMQPVISEIFAKVMDWDIERVINLKREFLTARRHYWRNKYLKDMDSILVLTLTQRTALLQQ